MTVTVLDRDRDRKIAVHAIANEMPVGFIPVVFSFQPVEVSSNVYTEPVLKCKLKAPFTLFRRSRFLSVNMSQWQELFCVGSLLSFLKHD